MNEGRRVLVLGAAAMDTKGIASGPVQWGRSNPGHIRNSVGGVARNIAENLSRLGTPTTLISAVGDDQAGRRILRQGEDSGIDMSHVMVAAGQHTSAYVALFDSDGAPLVSMYDMGVVASLTPRYLYDRRRLFAEAAYVVIDANLPEPVLEMVFRLAGRYGAPVCADPTSVTLAPRLEPFLPALSIVTPDRDEASVLTRMTIAGDMDAIEAAKRLVARGVRTAIVTMAERGVCYATPAATGRIPAIPTEIVDQTGGGDALTAAVVFGLLNDLPVDEALRLGVAAATLTLRCRETVCPDLTLQRLYDNLVI
jgi:pseudouridine kinase